MTDKKIIIDGIDVTGCVYFCGGYCNENDVAYKCNLNNENCYYKQFKRKEQECERLKDRVAELSLFQLYKIQRDEAEQALLEIKEIAKEQTKLKMYDPDFDLILQKISEVLDEEI